MKPTLRDLYIAASILAGLWGTMVLVCIIATALYPIHPTP